MTNRLWMRGAFAALAIYFVSRLFVLAGFNHTRILTEHLSGLDELPAHMQVLHGIEFRWLGGVAELHLPPPPIGSDSLVVRAWPIEPDLAVRIEIAGLGVADSTEAVSRTFRLGGGIDRVAIPLPRTWLVAGSAGELPALVGLRMRVRSATRTPSGLPGGSAADPRELSIAVVEIDYAPVGIQEIVLSDDSVFVEGAYAVEHAAGRRSLAEFIQGALFRWDDGWYREIATSGYRYDSGQVGYQNPAFFPLYPLLVRLAADLFGTPIRIMMLILSNLLALATVLVLYAMARRRFSETGAGAVILCFSFYPGSLFLSLGFTESLTALLVAGMLGCLDRNRHLAAAILVGLATAARPTAIVLVPVLVWSYWSATRTLPSARQSLGTAARRLAMLAGLLLLSVSGIASYAGYCGWKLGDPLAFVRAQSAWGQWRAGSMAGGFTVDLIRQKIASEGPIGLLGFLGSPDRVDALIWIAALTLIVLAALPIIGTHRLPGSWTLTGVLLVLLPLAAGAFSSKSFDSMTRYLVIDLPAFLAVGSLFDRFPGARWVPLWGALLAVSLFAFAALFASASYFVG